MSRIERWSFEQKSSRRKNIGEYMPCPICQKKDGLSIWEGERYLLCRYCGAKYQKKQRYIKPKPSNVVVDNLRQTNIKGNFTAKRLHTDGHVTRMVQFRTSTNNNRETGRD